MRPIVFLVVLQLHYSSFRDIFVTY